MKLSDPVEVKSRKVIQLLKDVTTHQLPTKIRKYVGVVAASILATTSGIMLFGVNTADIGPLRAEVRFIPAITGGSVIDLGLLGEIRFNSHIGPLRVDVEVRSMSATAAGDLVTSDELEKLPQDAVKDLRKALLITGVKATAGGLAVSLLAGWLIYRKKREVLAVFGTSMMLLATACGLMSMTYNPSAILEPRYRGLVASVPSLIGDVQDIAENFDRYRNQLDKLLLNVSKLYSSGMNLPSYDAGDETVTLLHVSDLHLNPQGMDMIHVLAKQFGIDVVVDTGDISDHGTSVEDPYLEEITKIKVPYLFVRGNHDSLHTQDVIRSKSNAIVLDNYEIVTIAGLTFSGVGDPRFTPDKSTPKIAEKAVVEVVAAMAAAIKGKNVDIAMVHDATATAPLTDSVSLVLSGHTHKRETVRLSDMTTLMVSGSTGGGGLRALSGNDPAPLEATIIHISKTTRRVVAWDEITMGGLGSATVQVTRHLPENLPSTR